MIIKYPKVRVFILILFALLMHLLPGCSSLPPNIDDFISASPGDPQPAGSCTDYAINGWGDCGDFLAACGTGGGNHAHALNESGWFPSTTYTCIEGRHGEGN